jgi:DNA-binding NtrC family response regulator
LCSCLEETKKVIENERVDIVVCEDQVGEETFRKVIELARKCVSPVPIVVASRTGEWDEFLRALRQGAFDYLVLPPRIPEVKRVLDLALREASGSGANQKPSLANQISTACQLLQDFKIHAGIALANAVAALHRPLVLR